MFVSSRTKKTVMVQLCRVLKDWPFHRTSTSDGDNTDVFALAVSFCTSPLSPQGLHPGAAIPPPLSLRLPASGGGLQTWLRAF